MFKIRIRLFLQWVESVMVWHQVGWLAYAVSFRNISVYKYAKLWFLETMMFLIIAVVCSWVEWVVVKVKRDGGQISIHTRIPFSFLHLPKTLLVWCRALMPPSPLYNWVCVLHSVSTILSHAASIRAAQATRREEGKDSPTMPLDVGSPTRVVRHP